MTAGDPIWYRQHWRGGAWDVPGFFVKVTPQRVMVRLMLRSGGSATIAVLAKHVRPRDPEAALWDEAAP